MGEKTQVWLFLYPRFYILPFLCIMSVQLVVLTLLPYTALDTANFTGNSIS